MNQNHGRWNDESPLRRLCCSSKHKWRPLFENTFEMYFQIPPANLVSCETLPGEKYLMTETNFPWNGQWSFTGETQFHNSSVMFTNSCHAYRSPWIETKLSADLRCYLARWQCDCPEKILKFPKQHRVSTSFWWKRLKWSDYLTQIRRTRHCEKLCLLLTVKLLEGNVLRSWNLVLQSGVMTR